MCGKLVPSYKEESCVQIHQDVLKYSGAVHLIYSHINQD